VVYRSDRNRVVDDDGVLFDIVYVKNRDLWLIDQRKSVQRFKNIWVGDGERARLHFIWVELLRMGAGRDILNRLAEVEQVLFVCISDHRNDQFVFECDRDVKVDVLLVDDVVAVDRCIDDRKLPQCVDDDLRDEGGKCQLRVGRFVRGLLLVA